MFRTGGDASFRGSGLQFFWSLLGLLQSAAVSHKPHIPVPFYLILITGSDQFPTGKIADRRNAGVSSPTFPSHVTVSGCGIWAQHFPSMPCGAAVGCSNTAILGIRIESGGRFVSLGEPPTPDPIVLVGSRAKPNKIYIYPTWIPTSDIVATPTPPTPHHSYYNILPPYSRGPTLIHHPVATDRDELSRQNTIHLSCLSSL